MNESTRKNDDSNAAPIPEYNCAVNASYANISGIVMHFVKSQLGLNPTAIFIDKHDSSITITLKNILSESEKYAAKDKRTAELITKTLTEAFRAVNGILVSKCSESLGIAVQNASLFLNPHSNYASIILIIDK